MGTEFRGQPQGELRLMQIRSIASITAFSALTLVTANVGGCSSSTKGGGENNVGGDDGGDDGSAGTSSGAFGQGLGEAGVESPCVNCNPTAMCSGGTNTTTITGVVYDPAGTNPVYNVQVYVPSMPLPMFSQGASCQPCSGLYPGAVYASAVTGTNGAFTIKNAPSGTSVPLVIQIGKWRRTYTIPTVTGCQANDANTLLSTSLRLPSSSSEGDLPDIAISTGAADSLECLPLRMGVVAGEYVPGASTAGHVHIFTGGQSGGATQGAVTSPSSPQAYTNLWDSEHDLNVNDLVLFSCEGAPTAYMDSSDGPNNMMNYLNNGGRVFASHYHFSWFTDTNVSPANPFVALTPPLATWSNLTNDAVLNDNVSYPATIVTTLPNGSPFPEGAALKTWLGVVNALDANQKLDVYYARDNALVGTANTNSQAWASLDPSVTSATTQYFSFDTPVGTAAAEQCGRAVYSDLHVSGGPGVTAMASVTPDYQAGGGIDIVPSGCAMRALTPQEKALEFMIFDLSSCLVPVGTSPPSMMGPQ
jgi:hypothetical protein